MKNAPDVIVVGLGVHGAATACELARRGAAVLAIDARQPPHDEGSSHGRTRIIREAYYEQPLYVPLVQRAYEQWLELEELTGTVLYRKTGGLTAGAPDGRLVSGALQSVRAHDIEHQQLTADEMARLFPALLPDHDHVGILEPRAGILLAEACVRTLLHLAQGYGAELRTGVNVSSWNTEGDDVVLHTSGGDLRAPHAVFTAGPWLTKLLESERGAEPLRLPVTVERQTSHWFRPEPGTTRFHAAVCPLTLLEFATGRVGFTIPDIGHGVKFGVHHEGEIVDPDNVERVVSAADEMHAREFIDQWMPGAAYEHVDDTVCLYTNTPDHDFILDRHPQHEQITLLSACSGHGFKFAPALAEAVADEVLEGGSIWDLTPFRVARLLE